MRTSLGAQKSKPGPRCLGARRGSCPLTGSTVTLPGRLEVPTLRLTASRSSQLSYGSFEEEAPVLAWPLHPRGKMLPLPHDAELPNHWRSCSVLLCFALSCSVLICVALVLLCLAPSCSLLLGLALSRSALLSCSALLCLAMRCCSMLCFPRFCRFDAISCVKIALFISMG